MLKVKVKQWKAILSLILLFSLVSSVYAEDSSNSPAQLKRRIIDFVQANIPLDVEDHLQVQVALRNGKNKIANCQSEIEIQFPLYTNPSQPSAVELRCHDEAAWHSFQPIVVHITTKALAAKHTILPHDMISEDDIDLVQVDKTHLFAGYFRNKEDIVGKLAVHMIVGGTIINQKNIHLPVMVRRNDTIDIIAHHNNVEVTMKGIAKTEGALHDSIQVMNPSSKRMVTAMVTAPNRAEVS